MTVRIVRAKYSSSEAFLEAYQHQFAHGGVFIPTRGTYALGSGVIVDVRFPELRTSTLVRGYVAWRRTGKQINKLRAGIGVEFFSSERKRRDFLLSVARGDVVDMVHRRHRRLPVNLQVSWRKKDGSTRVISHTDDIGERGAFIRTTDFRPIGSSVILEITAPGSLAPIAIEGRVARTHHSPGEEGMGIEFRCRDAGGARRLRELVRRLEEGDEQLAAAVAGQHLKTG